MLMNVSIKFRNEIRIDVHSVTVHTYMIGVEILELHMIGVEILETIKSQH